MKTLRAGSISIYAMAGAMAFLFASLPFALSMEMMVDGRDMNDRPAADPLVTKHRGDARLAKRVKDAIAQDANLSELAKQVKVYTNNGNVILKGMVASPEEKTKIESLTRETSSTALIENDLKIVRP